MKIRCRSDLKNVLKQYWLPGVFALCSVSMLCLLVELTLQEDVPGSFPQPGELTLYGSAAAFVLLLVLASRSVRYLYRVEGELQAVSRLLAHLTESNRKILAALRGRNECLADIEEAERVVGELHRIMTALIHCNSGVTNQVPMFRQSMRMLSMLALPARENELLCNCRELPDSMFGPIHHIHKLEEQFSQLQQTLESARFQIALAHNSITAA